MSDNHRCISGPSCRATEKGQPALTIDPDTLCDTCRRHITSCCRQLTDHWNDLRDALGDRQTTTSDYVRSTPTPAIPLNTATEAIMAEIVDIAERAATMIAAQLNINEPDARHATPKAKRRNVKGNTEYIDPDQGSTADTAATAVKPNGHQRITAAMRLVEPHIDTLAAAPKQWTLVFTQPRRCDEHHDLIELALELHAQGVDQGDRLVAAARHAAAECDECGGWGQQGQARDLIEQSGLDVIQQIRDIHNTARAHLGHTRLRHHYDMPCPAYARNGDYCGAHTVGRDDGSDWVDCTTCGARWTEREYDWLKTMIAGDKEIDMLRWLLAESYTRLDGIQSVIDDLENDARVKDSEAVQLILALLKPHLADHHRPENRKTAA